MESGLAESLSGGQVVDALRVEPIIIFYDIGEGSLIERLHVVIGFAPLHIHRCLKVGIPDTMKISWFI
jgi:hypothetical protein